MNIYLIENTFHNETYIIAKNLETAVQLFYKFIDNLNIYDTNYHKNIKNIKLIGYAHEYCIEDK